jgi:hypothetical protein
VGDNGVQAKGDVVENEIPVSFPDVPLDGGQDGIESLTIKYSRGRKSEVKRGKDVGRRKGKIGIINGECMSPYCPSNRTCDEEVVKIFRPMLAKETVW